MRDIYLDYMDVVWISFLDGAVGLIDMDVCTGYNVDFVTFVGYSQAIQFVTYFSPLIISLLFICYIILHCC
jgi:hypothetical protein